jgi:hypothetical protein
MKQKEDALCPMFSDPCRHCSHETTTHSFTRVSRNPKTHLYDSKGIGHSVEELGEYCNNIDAWVRDLHYCPARWALRRGVVPEKKVVKKKVMKKKVLKKKTKPKKLLAPKPQRSAPRPKRSPKPQRLTSRRAH